MVPVGPWADGSTSGTVVEQGWSLVTGPLLCLQVSGLTRGTNAFGSPQGPEHSPARSMGGFLGVQNCLWTMVEWGWNQVTVLQGPQSGPQSVGLLLRAQLAWVLPSHLVDETGGRTMDKQRRSQVHGGTGVLLGPQLDHCWKASHLSPACLLEVALLSLGFHWCFTTY